jgi:hypothetical protein
MIKGLKTIIACKNLNSITLVYEMETRLLHNKQDLWVIYFN